MRLKKIWAVVMACIMCTIFLIGCGDNGYDEPQREYSEDEIIDFTMFIAMNGNEINDGNVIQELIAKKTGVRVKETWLGDQTAVEAVRDILDSGELPDLIDGTDGMMQLYEAGVLVPWDEYIEKYPNIKELYSDAEWESFRQADGHIYWANAFCNTYGMDRATGHNDEAFWIQCKVLAWDNYPEIKTLDEYFDLIERYTAANPVFDDGQQVIPYTMLCEGWRYFCIENAPEFLAGYPNDGSVIVDVPDMKIVDYNTIPEAERYFRKLNEEYAKGIIDPEFYTQSYEEYIAKLSTGRVLGMCDQFWNFAYIINDNFIQSGLDAKGCNYVPLGLTLDRGVDQMWHVYGDTLNNSSGVGITTSCSDPDKAFHFINDLLSQKIHDLRFWGIEGVDYMVASNGLYYRTPEMREKWADTEYQASHRCVYSYLPQWLGTSRDGKNAMQSQEQPSEFFSELAAPLVDCFKAYGAGGYPDMIGSAVKEVGPWYPMYSYSNSMTEDTPGGAAWIKMGECKHEWLPKVVMASDFDSEWADYMNAYNACNPQDFLDEMQVELDKRLAQAGYK